MLNCIVTERLILFIIPTIGPQGRAADTILLKINNNLQSIIPLGVYKFLTDDLFDTGNPSYIHIMYSNTHAHPQSLVSGIKSNFYEKIYELFMYYFCKATSSEKVAQAFPVQSLDSHSRKTGLWVTMIY